MDIRLEQVTRDNWEVALRLKVKEEQRQFVPEVSVSLAKVYIKPDGDNVEYIPFAIYDGEKMVGFVMHAYEADTTDMYWINGFIIDERYQRRGYGRAALTEISKWIVNRFPKCKEIRLTVYKENHGARELYKRFGFEPTGDVYGEEDAWRLLVNK
ncbi:GNAT family N-acetyltransferase [Alkalihalobacillus sp. AL-G]|uniref:GNAT family N-acetyltransferase n=1 Tax=Alkalihalobacillus sp. AL-G TaxID=2926399 RepID=UPI002729FD7E|nr:GNAT family N-acetyltransferase [Alkalihalobacillus sp. AL-G]WLD95344.1 GNAT family N-acetyltransferase [Alkalihalobacillus sp. AL-G]